MVKLVPRTKDVLDDQVGDKQRTCQMAKMAARTKDMVDGHVGATHKGHARWN